MNTPLPRRSLLTIFGSLLILGINLLIDLVPFLPYMQETVNVQITQVPDFTHYNGTVVLKIKENVSLKSPEIILKGIKTGLSSASVHDSYGRSLPHTCQDNTIRINATVSEDSVAINYSFNEPSFIDNVLVRDKEKTWSFRSQNTQKKNRKQYKRLLTLSCFSIFFAAIYLYVKDLHRNIYQLHCQIHDLVPQGLFVNKGNRRLGWIHNNLPEES